MTLRHQLDKLIAASDPIGIKKLAELVGATWWDRVTQLKADWPDTDIKSAGQYATVYARLVKEAETDDPRALLAFAAQKTSKSGSLRQYRAAIKWGASKPLKEAMRAVFREADRVNAKVRKASKDTPWGPHAASISSGIVYEEKLADIEGKIDSLADALADVPAKPSRAAPKKQQTHNQRTRLSKLPDNWQERMLDRMKRGRGKQPGKWTTHAEAIVLVGARPCELESLSFQRQGSMLLVTVKGAKLGSVEVPRKGADPVTYTTGRNRRQFVFDPSKLQGAARQAAMQLYDKAPANGTGVRLGDSEGFASAWRAAAAREFGDKLAPAAYANRHQFSSELKVRADSIESSQGGKLAKLRQDIAAGLGHASTATQKVYGRAAHAQLQGLDGLVSVTATGTARDTVAWKPPGSGGLSRKPVKAAPPAVPKGPRS